MGQRSSFFSSALCLLSFVTIATCFTHDATIKYFTDISMTCDHDGLNVTDETDVRSLSWIFPDGTAVDSTTILNSKMYQLSGPSDDVSVAGNRANYDGYNLTVFNVNDDVFGYYTCIVVYNTADKGVQVIRWGLNIDGADFSELIDTYKENAIIGGIAAAIMLVLIIATCLLWHFRFSNRNDAEKRYSIDETVADGKEKQLHNSNAYCNTSFNNDADVVDVEFHGENGGSEVNVKM